MRAVVCCEAREARAAAAARVQQLHGSPGPGGGEVRLAVKGGNGHGAEDDEEARMLQELLQELYM